jgi:hypothetical protein
MVRQGSVASMMPLKYCVTTMSDQNERGGKRRAQARHTIFCMIEISFFA